MQTKTFEAKLTNEKKAKTPREASHSTKFFFVAVGALLFVISMMILAKFTAFKVLFWLE